MEEAKLPIPFAIPQRFPFLQKETLNKYTPFIPFPSVPHPFLFLFSSGMRDTASFFLFHSFFFPLSFLFHSSFFSLFFPLFSSFFPSSFLFLSSLSFSSHFPLFSFLCLSSCFPLIFLLWLCSFSILFLSSSCPPSSFPYADLFLYEYLCKYSY